MIRSYYSDEKVTANQFAKQVVYDKGTLAEYWQESYCGNLPTLHEINEINTAISKQIDRLYKYMGINKIL